MRMKRMVLIMLLALILIGCGETISEGIVTKKDYQEAYTSTIMMWNGKFMIPVTRYHPEEYWITIRDYEPDEEGQYITNSISISPEEYMKIQIGDVYKRQE